jgi:hypothetical protein
MLSFCEAIARQEGWLIPTSRCRRDNNPGNIRYDFYAQSVLGATGDDGGYAIFPSAQAGYYAMSKLLTDNYVGLTVDAAISKWAPEADNNPTSGYIANVCAWTALTPSTILTAEMLQPPILREN